MKQKVKISLLLLALLLTLVLSASSAFAQDFDNSNADLAIDDDGVISIESQEDMIVNIDGCDTNHVSFANEELKSAGDTVEPMPQVDSGVVSGGADFTAVHPAATTGSLVYTIPEDMTNVKSAIVIVNVYSGSADNTYALYSNVTLNTNNGLELLGYETLYLNKNLENDPNVYSINDHTTKQYCEYQMIYDITNRVNNLNSGDAITVNVANSPYGSKEFDGRIKLIGLLFAYDDGDNDNYTYWLHAGQLWTQSSANFDFNTRNYAGKTDNISLRKIVLSSKAAHTYKINNVECGYDSATTLVFNYKDIKWNNISSNFIKGSDTNFWFETSGAYKTSVALLIASEVEPLTEVYVDYARGNDRNAGTSSSSAFKTISRALSKVEENGVIYVSGTNYLDGVDVNGLSINKNVSIIGLGSDAIINANNNCRIFNIANCTVNLSNLIFINGNAGSASVKRGGALYVDGAALTIDNCKFVNNGAGSSTLNGKSIYLKSSTTSITNSDLLDGKKGVYVDGGAASLENNWWGNNETNKNSNPKGLGYTNVNVNSYLYLTMTMFARGLAVGDTASVNVMLVSKDGSGSEASNLPVTLSAVNGVLNNDNIVMMNGLASSVYTITATGSNSVTADVLGIKNKYTLTSSDVVSTDVIYVNSTGGSDSNSGANWNNAVQTIEKAISIVDNGGTIYVADGLYTLTDSTPATGIPITKNVTIVGQSINSVISGNNAKRIFSIGVGSTLNISKLTLTDAYMSGSGQVFGGAILIEDSGNTNPVVAGKLIIADSVISNSYAPYGGAIGTYRGSIDNVVNVTFVNNSANAGGALYIQTTNSIFSIGDDCKFINNSAAGRGSAIYSQSKVITGKDNLFYGNNASGNYGYGTIFAYGFELGNANVFADNVAKTGGALYLGGTKYTGLANYCIFINNVDFNGCPVAKQAAKCQLTLDNCYWGTNAPDFSTLCNLGEITYTNYLTLSITSNNNQPRVGNSAVVNVDLTKNQNGATVDVDSLPDVLPLTFTVTNGNVNPISTELLNGVASTSYSPAIMGEGSVTTNIYSLAETYSFNVLPEKGTIFVDYEGGLDTNAGDSWSTAVKTIGNALEIVGKGKTIYIADGVNYLDDVGVNGLKIRKNVNIIGMGGNVVIDANNNGRIFDIGAYTVKLSNLIFINGNASGAGAKRGGALYVNGATLTIDNCKFINNTAGTSSASYGGAIQLKSSTTTIKDSYFENNIAFTAGGAIYVYNGNVLLNISNSTFKDNLASGSTARGAAICAYNTTIIDKSIFYGNGFTASGRNGKSIYKYAPDSLTITNSVLLDGEKGVWIAAGTPTTLTNNWWGNNETTKNSNPKSLGYTNANVNSYLVLSSKIGQEKVYKGDSVAVTTTLQNNLVELPVTLSVNKGQIAPKKTSLITSSVSTYNATKTGNVVITIDVLGIKNEIRFTVKETLPAVSITEVKTQWKDGIYPAVNNTFTVTINNAEDHTVEGLVLEVYSNETGALVASYAIDSLPSGTSTISVTDSTIRPLTEQTVWPAPNNDKIKFTFNIMRGDDVASSFSVDKMLAYNGYFNKTYAYGGHDNIINRKYTVSGDIIISTQDVSVYRDQYSRFRKEIWNIQTPEGAEIVKVLLYFNFNWDTSYYPNGWNLKFNEVEIIGTDIGYEMDRGNLGGWGAYNYGSLVFDVTDYYRANANNSFVINKTGKCALYPSTLYVLYNLTGSNSVKDVYFTDICDVFYPNYNQYGYDDLLSVLVNFNDIDLQNMVKATWYAFGGSGGSPDADLKFNDLTVLDAYKDDSANDCRAYELDVTDVISQNNLAQFITTTRSSTIVAYEQVLVVEKARLATNLDAENLIMKYNDGSSWDVTLTDSRGNAIPNVKVKIGIVGKFYTFTTDADGVARLLVNLNLGTYAVNATFEGDDCYESSFVSATITVNKAISSLTANNLVMTYNDGSSWSVTLKDGTGKAISNAAVGIGIVGKVYTFTTDADGVAGLSITLAPGTYNVNASFNHARYESSFVSATITVNKAISSLTATDLVMAYNDGSSWVVTLKDGTGKAISNAAVGIGIVGKVYTFTTDADGVAELSITLAPGTYNVNASFNHARYESSFVSATITVNKANPTLTTNNLVMFYKDGSSFKATLKDNKGKAIVNTVIKFTILGRTYTAETNSNGVASLAINLKQGTYDISTQFDGNNRFNAVVVSNTIIVKDTGMSISASDVNMVYKDGSSYDVQLVNSNGQPVALANEIVKITIVGKTYDIRTNANGIASLPINLKAGTYPVSAAYNGKTITNTIVVNNA